MPFKKPKPLVLSVSLGVLLLLVFIFASGLPKGSDAKTKVSLSSQTEMVYSIQELLDQLTSVAEEVSTEPNPVIRESADQLNDLAAHEDKVLAQWLKANIPDPALVETSWSVELKAARGLIKNLEAAPSEHFRPAFKLYLATVASNVSSISYSQFDSEISGSLERILKKIELILVSIS